MGIRNQGILHGSEGLKGSDSRPLPGLPKPSSGRISYSQMVKGGATHLESLPMVIGTAAGNGWLYKSAVATFANHRNHHHLFESFMNRHGGSLSVKWMGFRKILITFQSESEMRQFIEDHTKQESYWFSSVTPWSVTIDCCVGREVWLCCYGVPLHAWNSNTFWSIGSFWGEVLNLEEDTSKCLRGDVGKVKIYTHSVLAINQQMELRVGNSSFIIRVAEEQAVFICNSNFSCGCACHGREDEQPHSPDLEEDDDDVERDTLPGDQQVGEGGSWDSFIAETQTVAGSRSEEKGIAWNLGEEEMRGCGDQVVSETESGLVAQGERENLLSLEERRGTGVDRCEVRLGIGLGSALSHGSGSREASFINSKVNGPGLLRMFNPLSGQDFNTNGINLAVVLDIAGHEASNKFEGVNCDSERNTVERSSGQISGSADIGSSEEGNQYAHDLSFAANRLTLAARSTEARVSDDATLLQMAPEISQLEEHGDLDFQGILFVCVWFNGLQGHHTQLVASVLF
ncbi:hypothetical protein Dimus_036685 [Dionaea muscipula]